MRIYILKLERKWLRGNTYRTYSITSPLLETDTRRKKVKKISLQVLLLEGVDPLTYIFLDLKPN